MNSEFRKRIEYISEFHYDNSDEIIDDLFEESELIGVIPVKESQDSSINFIVDILIPAVIATFVKALWEIAIIANLLIFIGAVFVIWRINMLGSNPSRKSGEFPLALVITKNSISFVWIMEINEEDGKYYELNSVEEVSYQYPKINEVLKLKRKGNDIYKKFNLKLPSGSQKRFEILSSKLDTSTKYFKKNIISSKGLLTLENNFNMSEEDN